MTTGTKVYVTVTDEGVAFGHRGEIRSSATGRVLATGPLKPYGMRSQARVAAIDSARESGYFVEEDKEHFRES